MKFKHEDLRFETYTHYSMVRITHLPTGLVVSYNEDENKHRNRARVLKILRGMVKGITEETREKK